MSRPWREPRLTPDEKDGTGRFSEFAGVVNTRSRKDLGLRALFVGDNVAISDTKKITRRAGYSLTRAGVTAAFGTGDNLYVVEAGVLKRFIPPSHTVVLVTGMTGRDYGWAEVNGEIFFANGAEAGIVRGDTFKSWRLSVPPVPTISVADAGTLLRVPFAIGASYDRTLWRVCATYELDDGRETAPSDVGSITASPNTTRFLVKVPALYARTNIYISEADGAVFRLAGQTTQEAITIDPREARLKLSSYGTSSLPTGVYMLAFYQGRCFAAEYIQQVDLSVIWISDALGFHLFNQAEDFILVPGRVGVLLRCNTGLLIGTTQRIYHRDAEGNLDELADYGVVPGTPGDTDAQSVAFFWTTRGFCKAMPFENLSEQDMSMPPGVRVASKMVYLGGMQQFVTVTQGGGDPFNARTERT